MNCHYCRHSNSEDEPRCQRCGRRLQAAAGQPAPVEYAISFPVDRANALAPLVAPASAMDQAVPLDMPPQRAQVPRQTRLFADPETGRVLQFPSAAKPAESKPHESRPRARRHSARSDSQAFLDFLPPAPHAPRTLKTSVEAVIYCDAPVATPLHRAVGAAIDFSMIVMGFGVFLVAFHFCGGEFETINAGIGAGFGGAFVGIALFYGLLWVLTGTETAGQRLAGLRLINFDGSPIDKRERAVRFGAACLSFGSACLGVLWSLADEEGLTWHDHMSKTFPTVRI